MKIYLEDFRIIYVKYILANISQKIYAKYILIIQLFAKIYFIYLDIYVTYIFFHVGQDDKPSIKHHHVIILTYRSASSYRYAI